LVVVEPLVLGRGVRRREPLHQPLLDHDFWQSGCGGERESSQLTGYGGRAKQRTQARRRHWGRLEQMTGKVKGKRVFPCNSARQVESWVATWSDKRKRPPTTTRNFRYSNCPPHVLRSAQGQIDSQRVMSVRHDDI
jgi:hypothetical protein